MNIPIFNISVVDVKDESENTISIERYITATKTAAMVFEALGYDDRLRLKMDLLRDLESCIDKVIKHVEDKKT